MENQKNDFNKLTQPLTRQNKDFKKEVSSKAKSQKISNPLENGDPTAGKTIKYSKYVSKKSGYELVFVQKSHLPIDPKDIEIASSQREMPTAPEEKDHSLETDLNSQTFKSDAPKQLKKSEKLNLLPKNTFSQVILPRFPLFFTSSKLFDPGKNAIQLPAPSNHPLWKSIEILAGSKFCSPYLENLTNDCARTTILTSLRTQQDIKELKLPKEVRDHLCLAIKQRDARSGHSPMPLGSSHEAMTIASTLYFAYQLSLNITFASQSLGIVSTGEILGNPSTLASWKILILPNPTRLSENPDNPIDFLVVCNPKDPFCFLTQRVFTPTLPDIVILRNVVQAQINPKMLFSSKSQYSELRPIACKREE